MEITIKNYRCFEDTKPAKVEIKDGFTAFIGINNSGKSTLLRFFYEFRPLFDSLAAANMGAWQALVKGGDFYISFPSEVTDPTQVFCNRNLRPLEIRLLFDNFLVNEHATTAELIISIMRDRFKCKARLLSNSKEIAFTNHVEQTGAKTNHASNVQIDWTPFFLQMQMLKRMMYIGPFRNAISLMDTKNPGQMETVENLHKKYFDIDVGPGLIIHWRKLSTGPITGQRRSAIAVQSDIRTVFGFNHLTIQSGQNDRSIQLTVDDKDPYEISEVGSGIGQFFAVLANAAIKKPSYILIDEPELNLHPSLQLDFLTTLGKYAEHGVLFSTHSIGLARASAERIYAVRKKQGSCSELVRYENEKKADLVEFLGELSFSTYREFGFNKVLLVEGPTDVKTIQQFLRKYHKDHEILLLPMGGGSLINGNYEQELTEVFRISSKIYALIDSERNSQGAALDSERQQFVNICTKIGIHCTVLQRRATENYLTDQAVKAALGNSFEALGHFQRLDTARNGWAKSSNWRIADKMDKAELEATDLGQFIRELCES